MVMHESFLTWLTMHGPWFVSQEMVRRSLIGMPP